MNRTMPTLALVVVAIAALLAGPATAQDIRTEAITIEPPDGWVLSVWQGGTVEVGEFTPPGQTGAGFIDLVGYSALPRTTGGPADEDDLRTREQAEAPQACRRHAFLDRLAPPGWLGLVRICIGRDGQTEDAAELEFAATRVTSQGVYRVWRTHRAPYAELVARTRFAGTAPDLMNLSVFEAIVTAWEPDMASDLDRREICDLSAPSACRAFSRPLPAEFEALFAPDGGYVAGLYATGLNTISREQFIQGMGAPAEYQGPTQVVAIFGPGELDWNDRSAVTRVLRQVAYGQATGGGVLVMADPDGQLSAGERTILRARLVAAARQLQKPDHPPSILTISIPTP